MVSCEPLSCMRAELQWASRRRLLLLVSLGGGSSAYVVQLFEVCILLLEWVAPTVRVRLRVTMLVLRDEARWSRPVDGVRR